MKDVNILPLKSISTCAFAPPYNIKLYVSLLWVWFIYKRLTFLWRFIKQWIDIFSGGY